MTSGWIDDDPEGAEFVRGVCGLLSRTVAEIAPRGIAEWGSVAFERSADVDAEFLISLSDWEVSPTDQATARLRAAFCAVIDTWVEIRLRYDFRPMETPQ